MKFRRGWLLGLALVVPSTASADNWIANQWSGFRAQWKANRDWPEQYVDHDRAAARAPFAAMVANGWRSQNTVSDYHFDDSTGELNDTGKLKVRAILTNAPPQYRSLYVLRANHPDRTDARVRSVQEHAQMLMQGDVPPPVMVTTTEPIGASGEYVTGVRERDTAAAMPPVLPTVQRATAN
jgi:hypothetical protein